MKAGDLIHVKTGKRAVCISSGVNWATGDSHEYSQCSMNQYRILSRSLFGDVIFIAPNDGSRWSVHESAVEKVCQHRFRCIECGESK